MKKGHEMKHILWARETISCLPETILYPPEKYHEILSHEHGKPKAQIVVPPAVYASNVIQSDVSLVPKQTTRVQNSF